MGEVYRGLDRERDAPVAIKRLLDPRHEARFTIEARLLSQLRHRRVVKVLDHFHEENGKYVVMELVEGKDLAKVLRERGDPGLPVDEVSRYALQACEALRYVHEQQIVHRDVKPANLIVGKDGVVLVDFGIARPLDPEASGTIGVGTPRYMAPEVLVGGLASPRSDVFGLAATLLTLITGKPPMYGAPIELRSKYPDVTPEWEHALKAAMELTPELRVPNIDALARTLGEPLAKPEGQSLSLSVAGPARSRSLLEAVVRTAAGVFGAASASIALLDENSGDVVYQAAWGAGADEIVGVRLPLGTGIAGSVAASGEGQAVPDCGTDPRFSAEVAAGTGYVPHTMLVVPLVADGRPVGALSVLDRRDGGQYGSEDLARADLFAELTVATLERDVAPNAGDRVGPTESLLTTTRTAQ
jgi:hypothetical protein